MTEKISITDGLTNETTVREMSEEEKLQRESDFAAYEKDLQKRKAEEAAALAKREAALAKLAALGLEPDDLKALGL
jgi:hypothetical protein